MPAVAWTQDFHGNRKDYIEPGHLAAPQDYSNEVCTYNNVPGIFDVNILCIVPTRVDSLYRYDYRNNRLSPTFTMNFSEDPIPWHGYIELPNHYIGEASYPKQVSATSFVSSSPSYYIVDKRTGKGAFFRLYNDYFIQNIEPANLKSTLENALKSNKLTEEEKAELTILAESIHENDNNIILLAKLKH